MSAERKPFKPNDRSNNYHPEVLTNGWTKKSILLHFDDAVVDTNLNYRFTLNDPITDLVFAEWITVSTGLVGSLMQVDEFNADGQTTQKITNLSVPPYVPPVPPPTPPLIDPDIQPYIPVALPNQSSQCLKYWRFLSDTNNYLSPSLADPLMNPRNLYYINTKLYTVAGVPKTIGAGAYIQLFLWSYCCK